MSRLAKIAFYFDLVIKTSNPFTPTDVVMFTRQMETNEIVMGHCQQVKSQCFILTFLGLEKSLNNDKILKNLLTEMTFL